MRIGLPHSGRGHPPRAGPAPAVPPLVAGEPRGGLNNRNKWDPLPGKWKIWDDLNLNKLHAFVKVPFLKNHGVLPFVARAGSRDC